MQGKITTSCYRCSGAGTIEFWDNRKVSERLRYYRRQNNVGLLSISEYLNLPVSEINALEHGEKQWTDDQILNYELAVEVLSGRA